MIAYLGQRLAWAVAVLVGISLAVFLVVHLSGDPTALYMGPEGTKADYEIMQRALGFDRPLPEQYGQFLLRAVQGDFGRSLRHRQPTLPLVLERFPATIILAVSALVLATLLALPLGVMAAVRRGSLVDSGAMVLALVGQCMPTFWLGILLILVFAVNLRWLPVYGGEGVLTLVLPAVTLGVWAMARTARITRSSMLEVLNQDFLRTARAKGIGERAVILRHALRNGAIPIVTALGLELGNLLGGAVITEAVFAYPGIGRLAVEAVVNKDVPLIQAVVFTVAAALLFLNIFIDLVYAALDPGSGWVTVMRLDAAGTLPASVAGPAAPRSRRTWRRTRILVASGGARFGAAILLVVAACAVAPGWLAPADPNEQNLLARFTRPASRAADGTLAVLGTDQLGRDILSRVIHGAKTSVLIGLSAVLLAGTVGTSLGLVAGMRGGPWDHTIMRLADMQFAFPFILLAITVIGVLGASVRNIVLVVGLGNWVAYARVVRAETLATREKAFVDAARALGVSLPSIVCRHVLPNVSASLIVVATFGVAGAILTEAGLSFLGLGVPLAIPSWGGMLAEGRQFVDTRYWLALFPGAALFVTVMGINLVGDALRDALDPYLQTRHTRTSMDRL